MRGWRVRVGLGAWRKKRKGKGRGGRRNPRRQEKLNSNGQKEVLYYGRESQNVVEVGSVESEENRGARTLE